jgi:hypothetical protein
VDDRAKAVMIFSPDALNFPGFSFHCYQKKFNAWEIKTELIKQELAPAQTGISRLF